MEKKREEQKGGRRVKTRLKMSRDRDQPLSVHCCIRVSWEGWRKLKPAFSCEKGVNMKIKKLVLNFK